MWRQTTWSIFAVKPDRRKKRASRLTQALCLLKEGEIADGAKKLLGSAEMWAATGW